MLPSGMAAATSRFHSASGRPSRRSSRPAWVRGVTCSLSNNWQWSLIPHQACQGALPFEGVRSPSPYRAAASGSVDVNSMYWSCATQHEHDSQGEAMHQMCSRGSQGCFHGMTRCMEAAHLENKAVAGCVKERCIPGSSIGPGHGETEGVCADAEVVHGRSAGQRVPCAQADLSFCLGGLVTPLHPRPMFSGVASPMLWPRGSRGL